MTRRSFGLGVVGIGSAVSIGKVAAKFGYPAPLVEPACSRMSVQNRKKLVRPEDRVVAWIRTGQNGGGAIPLRLLLSVPRVLDDSYGLFFYDAEGDYVTAFRKNHGFAFHGYRHGVMVVRGQDGTLWSALTGAAFEGPRKGERLERIPSLLTTWAQWLLLHPESTAYELFDGHTYPSADLPPVPSGSAPVSTGPVDARLRPATTILGVQVAAKAKAYALGRDGTRCVNDTIAGQPITIFCYGPTQTTVAFSPNMGNRHLTFDPELHVSQMAPFKDRETNSRWTLAGEAVEGSLKGSKLTWIDCLQCRWYAWAAEHPGTAVYSIP